MNPIEPPYSKEIEAQLLGSLMIRDDAMERLNFLKPEHFYVSIHQKIFAEIEKVYGEGKLITALSLAPRFGSDPDLAEVGGAKYLVQCVGVGSALAMVEKTAQYLVELSQRRKLLEHFQEASIAIASGEGNVADHASRMIEWGEGILDGDRDFQTQNGEEVFQEIVNDIKHNRQPISTGLPKLDKCMDGGLYAGKAYGFAAEKKMGKTILASTLSCNLATAGIKHLFVCAEMSPKEIHQRNISRMGEFYPSAFRSSYANSHDFNNKLVAASHWKMKNILFRNAPMLTFDKLRTTVLRAIIQQKIKGFILDYWQLVGGKRKDKSTSEHLDEVAQWIADSCRKYDVWAIVMAQINQTGTTRGSEGMRLAFDQVYQIHREDKAKPEAWLEMMETRYTPWNNIGSKDVSGWKITDYGPAFEELA